MKRVLFILILSIFMLSCGQSKYFISRSPEFSTLSTALKQLDKNDDPDLKQKIQSEYHTLSDYLLDDIRITQESNDPSRWENIIATYQTLNRMSQVIGKSKANSFVDAPLYTAPLREAQQQAAEEYYDIGLSKLQQANDKYEYREALHYLSLVNQYAPGYKDIGIQLDIAKRGAALDIVIYPVKDQSSFYSQMTPNSFGNSFNSDRMQRSLVNDLGGNFARDAGAHFYTDRDAWAKRINPDWIIDLTWTRLDIPRPLIQTLTIERSKEIKDTRNKNTVTVQATVTVTRRYFTAYGDLEYNVSEVGSDNIISRRTLSSQVDWDQSHATYKGDERALTSADKAMIGNRTRVPRKDQILQEIYNKIYPQLKTDLGNLVR